MSVKTSHGELEGGRAMPQPDHGVMAVVTWERAEHLLLPFAFLEHEAGLGERLSRSAFPPASLRLLCLYSPNKGRLISSNYRGVLFWGFGQELVCVWQTRSRGRVGWASLRAPARLCPDALGSLGKLRQEWAALHATSMNSLSGNASGSVIEFF